MDHTQALHLMKLAPAMLESLEEFVRTEDAYERGDVTFTERANLRNLALARARRLVDEAKETKPCTT